MFPIIFYMITGFEMKSSISIGRGWCEMYKKLIDKKKNMAKQNLGFTLIELIVIVAIIGIVSVGGTMAISTVYNADALKVAKKIESAMTTARMETMSKADKQYLYLYVIDNSLYMKQSSADTGIVAILDENTGIKLSSRVNVVYSNSGYNLNLIEGAPLRIGYLRSTGAFDSNLNSITLKNTSKEYIISCVTETGKHWIK